MEDWVEVVRSKLSAMGILNPKGNLYSTTPLGPPVTKPVIRDPTSPLPQPPPAPPPTTATTTTTAASATTCPETSSAGSTPRKPEETATPSKSQKVNIEPTISSPPAITTRPSQVIRSELDGHQKRVLNHRLVIFHLMRTFVFSGQVLYGKETWHAPAMLTFLDVARGPNKGIRVSLCVCRVIKQPVPGKPDHLPLKPHTPDSI